MLLRTVTALLTFTVACAAHAGDYPFDEFVTSYWWGPPQDRTSVERYQEIKDANFNVAFPAAVGPSTVEQNRKQLDVCQQVGLKAVIHDERVTKALKDAASTKELLDAVVRDYSDHPALRCYFVVDEPSAADFPDIARVVAYLKEKDPKHPGYVNLFPTHALADTQLGTPTYVEHLDRFTTTVKPFVVSYDHYSFLNGRDSGFFSKNLAEVRNAATKADVPFWNIVQLVQHYDYRELTEGEMRFQAMQTLAFGGKGLLWYTYWYPGQLNPTVKHAMIEHDGSHNVNYDRVKAINHDARLLGNEMFAAKSWATWHVGEAGEFLPPKEDPIGIAGPGKLTIGILKEPTGRTFALIANRDYKNAIQTRITMKSDTPNVQHFSVSDKKWSPAKLDGKEISIDFPPGAATLFRWEGK